MARLLVGGQRDTRYDLAERLSDRGSSTQFDVPWKRDSGFLLVPTGWWRWESAQSQLRPLATDRLD